MVRRKCIQATAAILAFVALLPIAALGQAFVPIGGQKSITGPLYWSEDTRNDLQIIYAVGAVHNSLSRDGEQLDEAGIDGRVPVFIEGCGGRLGLSYQNARDGFRDDQGVFFRGGILPLGIGDEPEKDRSKILARREDFPPYVAARTIWANHEREIREMQPNGWHVFDVPRDLPPGYYRLFWVSYLGKRTDHRLLGLGVPDRKTQLAHGYVSFYVSRVAKPIESGLELRHLLISLGWTPFTIDNRVIETREVTKEAISVNAAIRSLEVNICIRKWDQAKKDRTGDGTTTETLPHSGRFAYKVGFQEPSVDFKPGFGESLPDGFIEGKLENGHVRIPGQVRGDQDFWLVAYVETREGSSAIKKVKISKNEKSKDLSFYLTP